jgi:hypothetical protein
MEGYRCLSFCLSSRRESAFVFAVAVTVVCSTPATNVISTGGGAFAAAVGRSLYFALAIAILIPAMCM